MRPDVEATETLRIRLAGSIGRFLARIGRAEILLGEIKGAAARLPLKRPLLCRFGLHRWTAWNIEPGDFRSVESKCRRCGARRLLVWRPREAGAAEIAAKLRRDLCQRRPSGK